MDFDNYMTSCRIIFNHYGKQAQERQLIQELGELIVAITKGDLENIIEEMADVQVMIDQFALYKDYGDKIIPIQHQKVLRQLIRIKKEKESKLNGTNNARGVEKANKQKKTPQKQEKIKK